MRMPPPELASLFEALKSTPSDINEHLGVLFDLASKCEHVTEFGTRGAMGSTVALLAAQPKTFVAWDINPYSIISQPVANLVVMTGQTAFQPRVGNTLEVEIEETDFLFIDTLHTYAQLKAELARHSDKVRKYLAFHDTMTFGRVGEDGTKPGLRAAIIWFQKQHRFPLWKLVEDRPNNNGLVILEHI